MKKKAISLCLSTIATAALLHGSNEKESNLSWYAEYTAEGFYNFSGGIERGGNYLGLANVGVEYDLSHFTKAETLYLFANVLFLHGSSVTNERIGDSFAVSNLDSDRDNPRLFEAGVAGSFAQEAGFFKIGQLATDSDFFASDYSSLFLHASLGWSPAAMEASAPAYAQASLGAFLSYAFDDSWSAQFGLYSTDIEDPDLKSSARHGLDWNFSDSQWIQYLEVIHQQDSIGGTGLASTQKIGLWYGEGDFADNDGINTHDNNWGIYGIIDQTLYQNKNSEKALHGFLRGSYSPEDRNVYTAYLDTGLVWTGWISGRPNDSFGIAYLIGFRSDEYQESNPSNEESVVEFTYQAVICDAFTIQPTIQYIANPGGPDGSTNSDAWAAGLRCNFSW